MAILTHLQPLLPENHIHIVAATTDYKGSHFVAKRTFSNQRFICRLSVLLIPIKRSYSSSLAP
jgi:hypothetical protein